MDADVPRPEKDVPKMDDVQDSAAIWNTPEILNDAGQLAQQHKGAVAISDMPASEGRYLQPTPQIPCTALHEDDNSTPDAFFPVNSKDDTLSQCQKPSMLYYGPPDLPESPNFPTPTLSVEAPATPPPEPDEEAIDHKATIHEPGIPETVQGNPMHTSAFSSPGLPPRALSDILSSYTASLLAATQSWFGGDSMARDPTQEPQPAEGAAPGLSQDQPPVATHVAPAMVPDYDMTDEAYAESTTTSYVTSIASEISRGVLENERVYPNYGQHCYGMPIDEDEMDRMDLQHRKYELVLSGRHFLAPIGPTPHRILDLGTGTGIWALDVADMYPSAIVTGVDIAPIQPKWVAPNCQFEIDDVEATWTYKPDTFDFIHFRDPLYVIRDWPKLARQCYSHIKPGGWCELACIYPVVMCDDGTMPDDSGFKVICDKFQEASTIMGAPTDSPVRFAQYLREAGFVGVSENIFKVPSSPWPKDRRLKQIGALEMTNVVEGAAAFGLRAFSQAFGWSKEKTELEMVRFRRDVKNRAYHQYCQYFVVYGQKPADH